MNKITFKIGLLSLTLALSMVSCSDDDDFKSPKTLSSEEIIVKKAIGNEDITKATKAAFINNYATIAAANYNDSYTTAVTMQIKINAFLANPSEITLKEARDSWLYARDFYGQTEAFREANGPIDNEELLGTEGQINAWPLDEGFIDYVEGKSGRIQGGLIGKTTFELTEKNIIDSNEKGGDKNISTGWHAIEFLLWGQDLNLNTSTGEADNYASSGTRPFTDYIQSKTAPNANRRRTYLKVVTNLLINDLKNLNTTWATNGSYRKTFEALETNVALTNILNGLGFISNGEIALERLDPAIDEEGQENEHSCFSDNTNQDMWANVNGIYNIIKGSYTKENKTKVTGTSLIALVANNNYKVAANLTTKAAITLDKLAVLVNDGKPFDEIISKETLGSNGVAGQLSSALKQQGIAIADAAKAIGITITIN